MDGTDSNNLVLEPNFYDVNIGTWSSPAGRTTNTNLIYYPVADPNSLNNFNPYANLQIKVDFEMTDWGTVQIRVQEPNNAIICYLIETDRLLSPGHHTLYWDGRDEDGEIYEGDFTIYQNWVYGVTTGVLTIYYDYPAFEVKDLLCNSYRIIPLYNEVSTISYELTRDSDITIDITDPDGNHFRTLVDDEFYSAGLYEVVWDGKDDNGKYVSTEGVYAATVTAADPNHSDIYTVRVGSITVYR